MSYLLSNGVFALRPFDEKGEEVLKNIISGKLNEVHFGFNGEGLCVRNICACGNLEVASEDGLFKEVPISVSAFVPPGGKVKFQGKSFQVIKVK